MKINWKVRFSNPHFYLQLAIAIFAPILTYYGAMWEDMTTWSAIGDMFVRAVQNPVVVVAVLASVYNAIIDPTTKGIGDSERALTYTKPQ